MKALLATSAGWRMLAPLLRPSGVTVLMYHSIRSGSSPFHGLPVDRFVQHMVWLAQRCNVIDPDHFEEALASPARGKPAVMLTFDDGYRDYHDLAYPVLERLRLPALVFLATGFMDNGGVIWTDAVSWAIRVTTRSSATLPWAPNERFELDTAERRTRFESVCKHYLKSIPEALCEQWRQALMSELRVDPQDAARERRMLDWGEVRAAAKFTRYGGHTHRHPILAQVSPARSAEEIRLCRDRIAAETGIAPIHFAYPNGRAQDFNETTRTHLKEHGFRLGYSTIEGVHRRGMDSLAIRRQPTGATRLGDFAWLVAGVSRAAR